jgi:hypothetical protein
MTAGVAAARSEPKGGWTRYGPPSYWSKLGRTSGTRDTRDYVAQQVAEVTAARDAGDRAGVDRLDRLLDGVRRREQPAADVHHQQRAVVATVGQPVVDLGDVLRGRRSCDDVDGDRGGPLVLPADGRQRTARRDEHVVVQFLVEDLRHPLLVAIIQERPEERDGDRVPAGPVDLRGDLPGGLLVELDHRLALAVDPLVHPEDVSFRDEWFGSGEFVGVEVLLDREPVGQSLRAAHEGDGVLRALRRHERRVGIVALDHRVGPDGRPVRDECRLVEQFRDGPVELLGDEFQGIEEPPREVVGRRRDLAVDDTSPVVDGDTVGMGASDVDVHQVWHSVLGIQPPSLNPSGLNGQEVGNWWVRGRVWGVW